MLGQLIGGAAIALEMALLARGLQNRLAFGCRFSIVYRFVIFQDLVRLSTFNGSTTSTNEFFGVLSFWV